MTSDLRPAPVNRADLPKRRRVLFYAATALLLSVYYMHYGATFEEGDISEGSRLTILARVIAVATISSALSPFRFDSVSVGALVLLYIGSGFSLMFAAGVYGGPNDTLFVNTLLQVPILIALASTVWSIDYARWFKFVAVVILVQSLVDVAVWLADLSLWESQAFVGGLGNPSSFGFLCILLFAFFLFHPAAGRHRFAYAVAMVALAAMSKSLFAVVSMLIVYLFWAVVRWRRLAVAMAVLGCAAAVPMFFSLVALEETFLGHKLSAAGALLGLVEYDIETAGSITQRIFIHKDTFAALAQDPLRLLFGHVRLLAYWPMDSQLLTYLGSFGAVMLLAFLLLHAAWTVDALRVRHLDGGFTAVALCLFAMIFTTSRLLDYFPVATFYFAVIAMTVTPLRCGSAPIEPTSPAT